MPAANSFGRDTNLRSSEQQSLARCWPVVEASIERAQQWLRPATPTCAPRPVRPQTVGERLSLLPIGGRLTCYAAAYPRGFLTQAQRFEPGARFETKSLGDNVWRVERVR